MDQGVNEGLRPKVLVGLILTGVVFLIFIMLLVIVDQSLVKKAKQYTAPARKLAQEVCSKPWEASPLPGGNPDGYAIRLSDGPVLSLRKTHREIRKFKLINYGDRVRFSCRQDTFDYRDDSRFVEETFANYLTVAEINGQKLAD